MSSMEDLGQKRWVNCLMIGTVIDIDKLSAFHLSGEYLNLLISGTNTGEGSAGSGGRKITFCHVTSVVVEL